MSTSIALQAAVQPPPLPTPPPTPPTPAIAGSPVTTTGGAQVYTVQELPRPMTRADVAALRQKRTELSNQLESATGRRDEAVRELRRVPDGQAKIGLEQRMAVLDQRIVQLEMDIAANGRALAQAPSNLLAGAREPRMPGDGAGPLSSRQITAISIVFTLAVLMPLALSIARAIFRRSSMPKPAPQILESADRLERMEHAVDAMAVEIERISEGQRFVTQLLAKRAEAGALGDGQPVRAGGS